MPNKKCKRMQVYSLGTSVNDEEVHYARNGNSTFMGCKNIPGQCGCTHAEIGLLKKTQSPSVVVVSHSPCLECAKALVAARVLVVYFMKPYRIQDGIQYLDDNGVDVYWLTNLGPIKFGRDKNETTES